MKLEQAEGFYCDEKGCLQDACIDIWTDVYSLSLCTEHLEVIKEMPNDRTE